VRQKAVAAYRAMSGARSLPAEGALATEKAEARKAVKAALRKLSTEDMAQQSSAIAERVVGSRWFRESTAAAAYVHCAKLREVDTSDLIAALTAARKACFVPLVLDTACDMRLLRIDSLDALVSNSMGILEPGPLREDGTPREDLLEAEAPVDLLILPGLAFDRQGGRLGRGGGYYDKFLAQCSARAAEKGWNPPLKVALAYTCQVLDESVPCDVSDVAVDAIITPEGVAFANERFCERDQQ